MGSGTGDGQCRQCFQHIQYASNEYAATAAAAETSSTARTAGLLGHCWWESAIRVQSATIDVVFTAVVVDVLVVHDHFNEE